MADNTPLSPISVTLSCMLPEEYCAYGPNASKCNKATSSETETKGDTTTTTSEKETKKGTKETKKVIKISNVKRNKKQSITKIVGVKQFGLKPNEVSKFIAKKFSVGANIDKTQGVDCINVQGDFVRDVAEILVKQFHVDEHSIEF